jgi:site-specific recombinase XerD
MNTIFFDLYMEDMIQKMILEDKKSSAEAYDAALKRIRRYFGGQPIPLSKVNRFWAQHFQKNLYQDLSKENTIRTYISLTRSVYNRVVKENGLTVSGNPFRKCMPPHVPVSKFVADIQVLHVMRHAMLQDWPYLCFSRDLFLFSYYAGGMSFRDMALLKAKDIRGKYVYFKRSRNGCDYKALVTNEMKDIMEHYPGRGPYVFPIITQPDKDLYKQYRSGLRKYNIHLYKLARLLQIDVPLHTPMLFNKDVR